MSHVADSPKNRHFEPISGRFTPSGSQIIAESGMGYPLLGTRETWVVSTIPWPLFSRLTPYGFTLHAPRQTSGVRSCADLPPAGYCLPPTT